MRIQLVRKQGRRNSPSAKYRLCYRGNWLFSQLMMTIDRQCKIMSSQFAPLTAMFQEEELSFVQAWRKGQLFQKSTQKWLVYGYEERNLHPQDR